MKSWLTGRRLVSLPFSDHCDPLVGDGTELNEFAEYLMRERKKNQWRYIECRIAEPENIPKHFGNHEQFCFHVLSLEPDLDRLFHNLHKSSTQRKIRRAEREELTYKEGSSQELLDSFYRLLVQTRRRHRVPPQPRKWFSNLLTCFGNQLKLRVAFHNKTPIASIPDSAVQELSGLQIRRRGRTFLSFWWHANAFLARDRRCQEGRIMQI